MTGSAKQSSFDAEKQKAGLLRRFAPRNDGGRARATVANLPDGQISKNLSIPI
jgi:hypothetical protein